MVHTRKLYFIQDAVSWTYDNRTNRRKSSRTENHCDIFRSIKTCLASRSRFAERNKCSHVFLTDNFLPRIFLATRYRNHVWTYIWSIVAKRNIVFVQIALACHEFFHLRINVGKIPDIIILVLNPVAIFNTFFIAYAHDTQTLSCFTFALCFGNS